MSQTHAQCVFAQLHHSVVILSGYDKAWQYSQPQNVGSLPIATNPFRLARLRELAAEFGVTLPPIRDDLSPTPFFPLPNAVSRRGVIPTDPSVGFNEFDPEPRSLAERLRLRMAADAKIARET